MRLAWIVAIARRGIGRVIHPKRVEFQRTAANRKLYEQHFQCPVEFGDDQNVLVFRKADVDERS